MACGGVHDQRTRLPAAIAAMAGDRQCRLVWRNELGGLTFEVGAGGDRCFAKWAPAASGLDLAGEAARLRWARRYTSVPRVLDQGADQSGAWLLTSPLPGESAVSPRWKASPALAVRAIGTGLRALHDRLPVAECPFSWSVSDRVEGPAGPVAIEAARRRLWRPRSTASSCATATRAHRTP